MFDMGTVPMVWRGARTVPLTWGRGTSMYVETRYVNLSSVDGKLYIRVLIKRIGYVIVYAISEEQ